MVAYQEFVALSQSSASEDRGMAAHLAAKAFVNHRGPADEQAALYAALIGFLEDPSVRVRGALAYGLLGAPSAPRPILLALLQDSPVIARAVAQHAPSLIDADLVGLIRNGDIAMLLAIAEREKLSARCAAALIARDDRELTLKILRRPEVTLDPSALREIAADLGTRDPEVRGALLDRVDLSAESRLALVEAATMALRGARIVAGAIAAPRLERLMRDTVDTALTTIGEDHAEARQMYTAALARSGRLSTRVLLHAVLNGHVLFFADCLAELSNAPRDKVFTVLEHGSRPALNALLSRCGLRDGVRNIVTRLILHARSADLADDLAARHFVVTALTEELIVEHGADIPGDIEEAFSYLCEQNIALARRAARGVMSAFALGDGARALPAAKQPGRALAVA